jgi:hypothetical protein
MDCSPVVSIQFTVFLGRISVVYCRYVPVFTLTVKMEAVVPPKGQFLHCVIGQKTVTLFLVYYPVYSVLCYA